MADDKKDDNVTDRQADTDGEVRRPVRPKEDDSDIDFQFAASASYGDLRNMQSMFEKGANVNFQEAITGATALHFAASLKSREIINWLAKRDGIDFLIKDKEGRLPSALAFEVADDPVIGRYLAKKQAAQARARGIDLKDVIAS